MNAVADKAQGHDTDSVAVERRLYAGQGTAQTVPLDYTALLPTDGEWSRDTLMRALVADALQRNGKVVDEDTLEATVAAASAPGGVLADANPAWKLYPGETRSDGRASPPFLGYALDIPVMAQRTLLAQADGIATQQAAAPVPVDGAIAQLRALAAGNGQSGVVATLAAIEAAIAAGQAARASGQPVDAAAVRALVEFATRMGKEREAARILERYTAIKGVESDARVVGEDIARVFNGRDPLAGKPLNTDQRVESAFNLIGNGFKLVGDLGAAAQLLGVGGRLASTLIGIAPAGIAIVGFAAGVYGLIRKAREAILEPQWDEFRARFPLAEGMEPKQFLKSAMRQIAGMPLDEGNALSTSTRILEILGQNPDTRARFLAFLKGKVEPDSVVDALASGRFESLDKQQAAELARASKGYAREFLEHEIDDTRRYVRDRDGDRTRGSYLLAGEAKANAERNTNKIGGTIDEVLRVAGVSSETALKFKALKDELAGQLGELRFDGKPIQLSEKQRANLPNALAAEAIGLPGPLQLMPSVDGKRLLAVSSISSESRQIASVRFDADPSQDDVVRTITANARGMEPQQSVNHAVQAR